ncbi:MAG: hypothetical protein ACKV19_10455 [Verrucomicrobiales bacterium]
MKKTIITGLAALALGLASSASAAFLGLTGSLTVTHTPGYSAGGAEYTVTLTDAPALLLSAIASYSPSASLAPNSIQTFCLEGDESAGDGRFVVNSWADAGGRNTDDGDPLSIGASWLYCQFARGILAGYDYIPGAGRLASARALQEAVWALEDERTAPVGGLAGLFYQLGLDNGGKANAAPGQNSVYVLNVTAADGTKKQDFMIYVPEGGSLLIVFGLSLCGLSVYRRRLQK